MNKNILLFIVLIVLQISISPAYSQVMLFRNYLEPATPSLKEELNKITTIDNNLETIIEDLREKAHMAKASKDSKIDLAAFLLRKVTLQKEMPYEKNENLLLEASEMVPGDFYLESLWGDILYFAGDYENSINHFENALNKNSEEYEVVGKCALAYFNVLNYEKSLEYLEIYLNKYPNTPYFLYIAGRCKFELHEFDDAIEYLEKAKELTTDANNQKVIDDLIRKAKEASASTNGSTQEEDQRFVITFAGNSRDDIGDVTFDMLNEIYYDVTNLLNCNPDVRFNVVFYLTEDYYKSGKNWSAAAANGLQIMVPLKTGYKDENYVKGTLAHEFTHTIINLKTNNRAPLWVHEGLAQYQEYTTAYGSPETLRQDFESCLQNDFIDNGLFIPLNKIPAYIGGSNNQDVVRGYVASYMAIRCMADYYGEQSFDTLLTSIGRGKSIEDAVKEATGKDYEEFEDELKAWIKNQ